MLERTLRTGTATNAATTSAAQVSQEIRFDNCFAPAFAVRSVLGYE